MCFNCFLLQEGIFDHVGEGERRMEYFEERAKENEKKQSQKPPTSSMQWPRKKTLKYVLQHLLMT